MSTRDVLLSLWHVEPFALAVCAAVFGICLWLTRGKAAGATRSGNGKRRTGFAWLGLLLLVIALVSPVATLAQSYLFSAHMLQHLLLLLMVPPLLLLGLPAPTGHDHQEREPGRGRSFAPLPITWLAGVGAMWCWHLPAACSLATTTLWGFRAQVVSLLLLGALFWWPIVGPRSPQRLSPPAGIAYLVSACFACTLLGIYVTFAPVNVCSIYMHPADPDHLLPLIQDRWGLTPGIDQQVGGLMMWVPSCLIYLSGVMGLLARWWAPGQAAAEPEMSGARP